MDASGTWASILMIKKIEEKSNFYLCVDTLQWQNVPSNYEMEIFTLDYFLPESCQWINIMDSEVVIIEEKEQFKNYTTCSENTDKPPYAVILLTKISVPSSIKTISKKLLKLKSKYELNLEIELFNDNQPEERIISLAYFYGSSPYISNVELKINIIN